MAFPSKLGNSTTRQLLDQSPALIVPLGATEQHGPHLPLDTDTRIASAISCAVADRLHGDWTVAPAIGYGASGEHEGFPGTVSIGTEALHLLLVELGRSAGRWAGRLLVVNGHGGNLDALRSATTLLRHEGRDAAWFPCGVRGGDAHAGRTETSLMLHVEPDAVRPSLAEAGNTAPVADLLPRMRAGGVAAVSPNGVLGDPAGASAAEGAASHADLVERLAAAVQAWDVRADGRLAG